MTKRPSVNPVKTDPQKVHDISTLISSVLKSYLTNAWDPTNAATVAAALQTVTAHLYAQVGHASETSRADGHKALKLFGTDAAKLFDKFWEELKQ